MRFVLGRGVEGGGGEVSGGQLAISAGDAASSTRSEASSSCVDAFYYEDIIPCNFSKCIFLVFIQVVSVSDFCGLFIG